jgi:hypothetical protein
LKADARTLEERVEESERELERSLQAAADRVRRERASVTSTRVHAPVGGGHGAGDSA